MMPGWSANSPPKAKSTPLLLSAATTPSTDAHVRGTAAVVCLRLSSKW